MGDNLEERIFDRIKEDYPDLEKLGYNQVISFDSNGDNYGFELRWYPGGQDGSFSLGLSVEKTTMKVSFPTVSPTLELTDGGTFQGNAHGELMMKPLSFHISFRWDIMPSWRLHPYITFGAGAAFNNVLGETEVDYYFSGDLNILGQTLEHYQESGSKTIQEIKDEVEAEGDEFDIPGILFDVFPFVQLNFGLKGVLSENIHVLVDAGVWNGFLIRGGIAFRL